MFKKGNKIVVAVLLVLFFIGLGLATSWTVSAFYYGQGLKAVESDKVSIAIADFQKSVAWNPRNVSAWENLGDTLRKSMYVYQGFYLRPDLSLQQYQSTADAAIVAYNHAIALGIQSPNAYYARGVLKLFAKGDATGARADLETSLKFAPNLAITHYMLGYLAMTVDHDPQSAATLMQQAIDSLSPDFPPRALAVMLNGLGWVYDEMKQYDKALTILQQAASADSTNCVVWNNIADVENNVGRYNQALPDAERSIATNSPTCILTYVTLGQIYENLHEPAAAEANYEKFLSFGDYIKIDPSGPIAEQFVLGRLSELKSK